MFFRELNDDECTLLCRFLDQCSSWPSDRARAAYTAAISMGPVWLLLLVIRWYALRIAILLKKIERWGGTASG